MRTQLAVWIVSLALVTSAGAQGPDAARPLEPDLKAALEDMRERDAQAYDAIFEALRHEPEAARERLLDHARYLAELREAKRENPGKYELMVEQEAREKEVRSLVDRLHQLPPEAPERRRLTAELRGRLDEWFELRQALRRLDLETFERELSAERRRLEEAVRNEAASREVWRERILEGGTMAMKERLKELSRPNELEGLAPILLHLIMQREPEAARHLTVLSEREPERFLDELRQITTEDKGLLDTARKAGAETLALHAVLRERLRRAHALLLPWVREDGELAIPPDRREEVDAALAAVAEAEVAITRANLTGAERELRHHRELLERRGELRGVIVDIQHARLTGGEDLYDW